MSDIEFNCPECDGLLVVDERGAGLEVKCPECSKPVKIPGEPPAFEVRSADDVQPTEPERDVQQCPFCAEEILLEAIKCRHCGEFLDDTSRLPPQYQAELAPDELPGPVGKRPGAKSGVPPMLSFACGMVFGVIIALVVLILLWR